MTYVETIDTKHQGRGALAKALERSLALKRATRVMVFRAGKATVLVPEDPEIRRIVERNERLLKKKGITVRDVLHVLRKERRAQASRLD